MNYWKFSFPSLGLLLLLGCSEPKATGSDWVRLDMTQSQSLNWNSILEGVFRLPLQTGDAPSIDTCHKVLKYKGHYYLLAQIAGGFYHIYIYDEAGALVNQISFDDSFFAVNLMEIEPESEELVVVGLGRFELRYDLEGNLKAQKKLDYPCAALCYIDATRELVCDGNMDKTSPFSLTLRDNEKPVKHFLQKAKGKQNQYTTWDMFAPNLSAHSIYVMERRNDTIYHYNTQTDEMRPLYHLDFHGDFLTKQDVPENGWTDEEMDEIITQRKYITGTSSFYLVNEKLFFKLSGKREDFCMIDLKTNEVYSIVSLPGEISATAYRPIVGSDGEYLYAFAKEHGKSFLLKIKMKG